VSEQTYLNLFFNTSWYHLPISYNFVSFLFAGAIEVEWKVGRACCLLLGKMDFRGVVGWAKHRAD
jgi:hypothetical protein